MHNQIKESKQVECPKDAKIYQNVSSVETFPINEMILQLMKDEEEICSLHGKPIEYFCLEEKVEVCSLCALFGGHNNHTKSIITHQQLKNLIENT